ncbi:23S rRNA (adenine(2030)-N(6))-methyltransferase RlmJ [Pandoraea pulmonicola]|uniref:Ribosomal RNA large subunit methyltransferase J n=1 Tax=Pandoraea pulmonicola TaxID=93221 RepID=A0AAJ4Z8U4_PANPU|nr:23S rRNA (adenine(2030)-N(6))-methyltransferase RlmJ [Pandoraea pulmonicola]AJC22086.1 competence protein ComJ [Pandoraea pulmonicola]SUA88915.1 Protein involved in catabolism of external DNA [Pandoraea pulmonicola]
MFSYRHAFHAGNHADVLKHFIAVECIDYMRQKDTAFWYIDTHAGAGGYALDGKWADKTGEYETGIGRLWTRNDLPPALADYVALVREFNPDGKLSYYPGSPYFALQLLGDRDRLRLFEAHPTEQEVLRENFEAQGRAVARRTMIFGADGFAGLKTILPPASRRAFTLIDPSYEDKRDYTRTTQTVQEGLDRFPTGMYAVWYPLVQRREAAQLPERMKRLTINGQPIKNWVHAALTVCNPVPGGMGLHGSGMFIVNPPYRLQDTLKTTLPYLVETLGQDKGAQFLLEGKQA